MHLASVYVASNFIPNHLKTYYYLNKKVLKILQQLHYTIGAACRRAHPLLVKLKNNHVAILSYLLQVDILFPQINDVLPILLTNYCKLVFSYVRNEEYISWNILPPYGIISLEDHFVEIKVKFCWM
jgi:hypothetical protein